MGEIIKEKSRDDELMRKGLRTANTLFTAWLGLFPTNIFGKNEDMDSDKASIFSVQDKQSWFLAGLESITTGEDYNRIGIFAFKTGYFKTEEEFLSYYLYIHQKGSFDVDNVRQFKYNFNAVFLSLARPIIRSFWHQYKDQLNEIYDKDTRLTLLAELKATYIKLYSEFIQAIEENTKSQTFERIETKIPLAIKYIKTRVNEENIRISIYLFLKYLVIEYCIDFINKFSGDFSANTTNSGERKRLQLIEIKILSEIIFEQ